MGNDEVDRVSHWRQVLANQKNSGLTVTEFCKRRRISSGSFYLWKNRLSPESIKPRLSYTLSKPSLVPVEVLPDSNGAEIVIELPNGIKIRSGDIGTTIDLIRQLNQEIGS